MEHLQQLLNKIDNSAMCIADTHARAPSPNTYNYNY